MGAEQLRLHVSLRKASGSLPPVACFVERGSWRGAPEQFEVDADYDLARFIDAIEHTERAGRDGAILIS